jgi:hypothetical protein
MTFAPSQLSDLFIKGPFKVTLTQSDIDEISITADEALLECIVAQGDDNQFSLSYTCMKGFNLFSLGFLDWKSPKSEITIQVTFQQLKKLELAGMSDTHAYPLVSNETFLLKVSGASTADVNITAPQIEAEVSGASTLTLVAQSADLRLKTSGASDLSANGNSERLRAEASGASTLHLTTQSKDIELNAGGASDITASGSGETVKIDVSGASEVDASALVVEKAELTASGASDIKVNAKEVLSSKSTGASDIENVR